MKIIVLFRRVFLEGRVTESLDEVIGPFDDESHAHHWIEESGLDDALPPGYYYRVQGLRGPDLYEQFGIPTLIRERTAAARGL